MSERPDLAVVMFDYVPSGVVRNALRIAGAARAAGLRTEVWTAQRAGEMAHDIPCGVEARSLGLDVGEDYSLRARKRALVCAAKPLAGMLNELRPRILLSAGNHFHGTAVAATKALAPATAPRLLGRVSNALPRFSWSPVKLPNSLMKRLEVLRRYQAMHGLIAVSTQVRDDLRNKLLIQSAKIRVIPNGIDIAQVERLALEPLVHPWFDEEQPPVVVAAGRLAPQKGFDLLLRAFALARMRRPMRLVILGRGPERHRLQALAKELGIDPDVELTGHVSNPMPYLQRAALFVLPSRWEGLSNSLLEALATGTPVVATRCTGSSEVLDRGRYGRLVRVGDVAALAAGIVDALAAPSPREHQIMRARHFDLANTLRAYVDLFEQELRQADRFGSLRLAGGSAASASENYRSGSPTGSECGTRPRCSG